MNLTCERENLFTLAAGREGEGKFGNLLYSKDDLVNSVFLVREKIHRH